MKGGNAHLCLLTPLLTPCLVVHFCDEGIQPEALVCPNERGESLTPRHIPGWQRGNGFGTIKVLRN